MQVYNINYINHLLTQKNRQLKKSSMVDFARSKRRLMSMESQYSIDNILSDSFTKSQKREQDGI